MNNRIRNIGIIAHVDHGKTTLVDQLLRQAGTFRAHQNVAERVLDSMDLEREKGITIKAKNTSVVWRDRIINIVDTPGHADFGGEVERILKMVDGVLLLVDAAEGPQAQTRFVLRKAIQHGLAVIVVLNKIDRESADPLRVHDQVLELLMELDASEDQFNAPFLYGSARDGYMRRRLDDPDQDLTSLFETIVEHVPPPAAEIDAPFCMLISNLDWDDYVGRIAIGKIGSGAIAAGDWIYCVHHDGSRERSQVTKLFTFTGLTSSESPRAEAGDIVGVAGFDEPWIGETLCGLEDHPPLPFVAIDPPTIQMQFCVNDGPLAGRNGKFLTARHLRDRLIRETRINVSIAFSETDQGNLFSVTARGELQIAVLVETMRREGYEVMISRPEVIYRSENGKILEPYETLWVEAPPDNLGDVLQSLAARKATVEDMEHLPAHVKLRAEIPTRGLIGLENHLINLTGGRAVMSHLFRQYATRCGPIPTRANGVLVSMVSGRATAFALDGLQQRGRLFIRPQEEVYPGMIVGEHARAGDLPCNPTKTKQLTNIRASGADKAIQLEPPVRLNLERAIEFIAPDEYVEATPDHLRLRKKILDATQRKRASQANAQPVP